jgi:uncharacterized protein (TIGR02599 family)
MFDSFNMTRRGRQGFAKGGFTLVEMLVSITIMLMLMGILASVTSMVSQAWRKSSGGTSSFQKARAGFEALTQTLSQATLTTYLDYVNSAGQYRNTSNAASFLPATFQRASELHFVSGPSATGGAGGGVLVPGGSAALTPGHAIFFQAPLGRSTNGSYQPLDSSLNEVGFYVQYSSDQNDWPSFLQSSVGNNYRYRLMEWMPSTENTAVYYSTSLSSYDFSWVESCLPSIGVSPASVTLGNTTVNQESPRVLADNVVLLVILPKLAPGDETELNGNSPPDSPGTMLCPKYEYDSRAWQSGYTGGVSGQVGSGSNSHNLSDLMRNQLPPLVDVVMIAISDKDMARIQSQYGNTATPSANSPLTLPANSFTDSTKLQADLQTYEQQLIAGHISFRTFSTTVQIQGAKWSVN